MMEFKPHAYQEYAIDYIKTHPVAAILLGCGLGKTSIALTAIDDMLHDSFDVRKVLVVAPIRVCHPSASVPIAGRTRSGSGITCTTSVSRWRLAPGRSASPR